MDASKPPAFVVVRGNTSESELLDDLLLAASTKRVVLFDDCLPDSSHRRSSEIQELWKNGRHQSLVWATPRRQRGKKLSTEEWCPKCSGFLVCETPAGDPTVCDACNGDGVKTLDPLRSALRAAGVGKHPVTFRECFASAPPATSSGGATPVSESSPARTENTWPTSSIDVLD